MYTLCIEFSNQSICLDARECTTCWHHLLSMITRFLSLSGSIASAVAPTRVFFPKCLSLFHHFIISVSARLDLRLPCLLLRVFPQRKGCTVLYSKNICSQIDTLCNGSTTSSNGRIHFGNAWWFVLGEVVQEEPADVEERLWHVGAEGLILKMKG